MDQLNLLKVTARSRQMKYHVNDPPIIKVPAASALLQI